MLPRSGMCFPSPAASLSVISYSACMGRCLCSFVGQGPMDFVPCRGRRVCLRAVPYVKFPRKFPSPGLGFTGALARMRVPWRGGRPSDSR
eukprot:4713446-Prymnesium_polylepis.1